jgi:hypothetical protein
MHLFGQFVKHIIAFARVDLRLLSGPESGHWRRKKSLL